MQWTETRGRRITNVYDKRDDVVYVRGRILCSNPRTKIEERLYRLLQHGRVEERCSYESYKAVVTYILS